MKRGVSLAERIERNTDRSGECWIWTAWTNEQGYGRLKDEGRTRIAHRASYECFVGPIPDGQQLDHLCRNRACVNPAHLEPVSPRENTLRGETRAAKQAAQVECIYGHPFDAANTYVTPDGRHRKCRTCRRAPSSRRAS